MTGFYLMSAESAEIYFRRVLEREAVTEKEKIDILQEVELEGLISVSGVTLEEPEEFIEKLGEQANVLHIKPNKKKPGFSND